MLPSKNSTLYGEVGARSSCKWIDGEYVCNYDVDELSTGAIVGIIVATILIFIVIPIAVFICYKYTNCCKSPKARGQVHAVYATQGIPSSQYGGDFNHQPQNQNYGYENYAMTEHQLQQSMHFRVHEQQQAYFQSPTYSAPPTAPPWPTT